MYTSSRIFYISTSKFWIKNLIRRAVFNKFVKVRRVGAEKVYPRCPTEPSFDKNRGQFLTTVGEPLIYTLWSVNTSFEILINMELKDIGITKTKWTLK